MSISNGIVGHCALKVISLVRDTAIGLRSTERRNGLIIQAVLVDNPLEIPDPISSHTCLLWIDADDKQVSH